MNRSLKMEQLSLFDNLCCPNWDPERQMVRVI